MRYGGLLFAFMLASVVTLPLAACKSPESIASPFSDILPNSVPSAPDLWFEDTQVKGSFYTENEIIEHYERAFKGEDVKFWADILVFADVTSAREFIDGQLGEGYFTVRQSGELPLSVVESKPDQSIFWVISREPTFIEGDEDEHGAETYGVLFRVGRYVGDYSITRFPPDSPSHVDYIEHDSPRYFTCLTELLTAVDDGIKGLQSIE